MATQKISYAASVAIPMTLTSLAQGAAREGNAVDNTSNLYVDAIVRVKFKLVTGTPGAFKAVMVYAYGSEEGSDYTDNATGSDAGVTLRVPPNFRSADIILTPDSGGLTYKGNPFSVATLFGGQLPRKWGIVVENQTNLAFSATSTDHVVSYTGVTYTIS